jgi:hypothetical protein
LLDPVSAALVLHLVSEDDVFVIATVETGTPAPDAEVSLLKDAGAQRLELEILDEASVGELVERALGGPAEQRALRWLADSSEGNALRIRESVLGGVDDETLARGRDVWHLTRRPSAGRSLTELGADERDPLGLLALGEPLQSDELIAMTSYEVLEKAEALGMATLEMRSTGAEVRLAHPSPPAAAINDREVACPLLRCCGRPRARVRA